MNKSEFVESVSEKANVTKKDAKSLVEATLECIKENLENGDEVNLAPLGKFKINTRAARKGRNPQTGEELNIPEKKVVKFAPSKGLKESVN